MHSIINLIGNTPLVLLKHLNPYPNVKIYAKLEGQNPGGSVKDRAAYNMIASALERGEVQKGDRLVEATSGNTGIALAMVARILDVKMTLLMPDTATPERIKTMKAYSADVILTPGQKTIEFARQKAEELSRNKGYKMLNQFANFDNSNMHYKTTGPEIWKDTDCKVTHFVSAMGTTGTIMGTSRFLKEQNPNVQIVGTQPTEGSRIPGIRRWSADMVPAIYEPHRVDRIIDVSTEEAIEHARKLANHEGIMGGMSSGGACFAALKIAQQLDSGIIVFIVCDRGDRYLSSNLYAE